MTAALALVGYIPDAVVVEVEPEPRADEDSMQIRLHTDDDWHRVAVGGRVTACGIPIRPEPAVNWMMGNEVRAPAYLGRLCTECFSAFERTLATDNNRKENDDG